MFEPGLAKLWRGLKTPGGKEDLVAQRPWPWVCVSLSPLVRAEVPPLKSSVPLKHLLQGVYDPFPQT